MSWVLAPRETQRAQIHPQRGRVGQFLLQGTPLPPHCCGAILGPSLHQGTETAPGITSCSETWLSAAWKPKKTPSNGEACLCSGFLVSVLPISLLVLWAPLKSLHLANPRSLHSPSLYLLMLAPATSTCKILPSLCSPNVGTCALSPPLTRCN